jgi:zinc-ribbon domain
MDIRCGKCNKLFRVADEKITGRGIKFSCTQCGDTVKITREDFNTYTLSKTAISVLDMFEPKPKLDASSILEPTKAKSTKKTSGSEAEDIHAPLPAPQDLGQSSVSIPDFLREKEAQGFSEPNPFEDLPIGEAPQPEQKSLNEVGPAITIPVGLGSEQESGAPIASEEKKKPEYHPEPAIEPKTQQKIPSWPEQIQDEEPRITSAIDLVSFQNPNPKSQPKSEEPLTQLLEPEARPAIQSKPAPIPAEVSPAILKEEAVDTVMEQIGPETLQTKPSHTGRMVLILMATIILLGVIGYGVYKFMLPSIQNAGQPATEMTSIDGLSIVNPSGSVEPNGDLLITGSVENLTDKDRSAWYVIVDVYDAKGNVLNKIRLLNGKQIYSRADYDVLSKRGVNVAELKAKILQSQGVVIPAKGSVTFEMRYIQPPIGIASFNAVLQPFDPIRLFKEIAKETK